MTRGCARILPLEKQRAKGRPGVRCTCGIVCKGSGFANRNSGGADIHICSPLFRMLAWAPFSRGPTQPHREAIDAQKFGKTGVSDVTNDLMQLYVGSHALDLAALLKRKPVSANEIVDTAISLI